MSVEIPTAEEQGMIIDYMTKVRPAVIKAHNNKRLSDKEVRSISDAVNDLFNAWPGPIDDVYEVCSITHIMIIIQYRLEQTKTVH